MLTEGFIPFYPIDFFEVRLSLLHLDADNWKEEIIQKKYLLPDLSEWLFEEEKIILNAGWSQEGLAFQAIAPSRMTEPHFPDFTKGDSLELFIDTRAVKEGRFIHRFCHQFYFLPEAVQGKLYGEATRFRGEDRHPMAREEDIEYSLHLQKGKSCFRVFLTKEALFGYDPQQCPQIGFCCRLNRLHKDPLHYNIKTDEFKIEEEPTLWLPMTLASI
jgi:hypothetical protein